MAKAKNRVISGAYEGFEVSSFLGQISIGVINISKANIINIEQIDSSKSKDVGSSIARGLVGGVLLGPAGVLGGVLLGKSNGVHLLSINFKNGQRSLIEVDDNIYKAIIKKLY
jgi:hypothetical protein